jgi:TonB family protein
VSEPEEQDLPFQRSSIAAIGARRRWRLFGFGFGLGESDDEGGPEAAVAEEDDGPPVRSMLGSLASRSGPAPEAEPASKSMLSLGAGDDVPFVAEDSAPADLPAGPLTAHSTIAELAGLEEHDVGTFPIERGILISIVFHVLLVIFMLSMPRIQPGSKEDFFAALVPQPKDDTPIPIIFQEAPGPARQNPKRSPLSDADRRAGGGDKSRPKADTPFVPPSSGVAGLAPGPRAPRVPGSDVAARQGAKAEAERRAAAEKSETDSKPSDFPSSARPQTSGPREVSKLAGLDRAIAEAARGAVGGEGGAPPSNPEGGFTDNGPLSFDTSWYDWGAYAAEMIRRIKLHWDVPELARLGWKGSLTVRFYIMADGTVADAKILRVSGVPPFDNAAFQAILKSSPFRPLPADLHEEREGVTITFYYNMRVEQEEASARP